SGELTDLGHDLARDHFRHFLNRRPDQLRERCHRHSLPQPVACTIATRPDKITYIPGTASPAWNMSSPAGNRLTSPKRRTRSISVWERTGNIWWNRDPRAPLDAAGSAGVVFPGASWSLRSWSLGTSDSTAGDLIQHHGTS